MKLLIILLTLLAPLQHNSRADDQQSPPGQIVILDATGMVTARLAVGRDPTCLYRTEQGTFMVFDVPAKELLEFDQAGQILWRLNLSQAAMGDWPYSIDARGETLLLAMKRFGLVEINRQGERRFHQQPSTPAAEITSAIYLADGTVLYGESERQTARLFHLAPGQPAGNPIDTSPITAFRAPFVLAADQPDRQSFLLGGHEWKQSYLCLLQGAQLVLSDTLKIAHAKSASSDGNHGWVYSSQRQVMNYGGHYHDGQDRAFFFPYLPNSFVAGITPETYLAAWKVLPARTFQEYREQESPYRRPLLNWKSTLVYVACAALLYFIIQATLWWLGPWFRLRRNRGKSSANLCNPGSEPLPRRPLYEQLPPRWPRVLVQSPLILMAGIGIYLAFQGQLLVRQGIVTPWKYYYLPGIILAVVAIEAWRWLRGKRSDTPWKLCQTSGEPWASAWRSHWQP